MTKNSANPNTAPGGAKTDFAHRLRAAFAHCLRTRLVIKLGKLGSNNTLFFNVLTTLHPATKEKLFASGVMVNKTDRDAVQLRLLADMTELRAAFVQQRGMQFDASAPVLSTAPRAFTQLGHLCASRQQLYRDQAAVLTRADSDKLLRSLLAQEQEEHDRTVSASTARSLTDPLWSASDEFDRWCVFKAPTTLLVISDPISEFWALDVYRDQFPALHLCALMWFGLPGTSSTSERMASKATRIYTSGAFLFPFFVTGHAVVFTLPSSFRRSRQAAAREGKQATADRQQHYCAAELRHVEHVV
jgi:hypothetical protein